MEEPYSVPGSVSLRVDQSDSIFQLSTLPHPIDYIEAGLALLHSVN